jgi:uncharacterized protein with HEPN domain
MRPEERDPAYLWDMLDAAMKARTYVDGVSLEGFLTSDLLQSAVERTVEIIGEAARRVSADFKQAHPEIPWAKIVAQRNVLAHEYGEVDPTRIWRLVVEDLRRLIEQLQPLVPEAPDED